MRIGFAAVTALMLTAACAGAPNVSPSGIALRPARCSDVAAIAPNLSIAQATAVPLLGRPFDVVVTGDGRWAFVGLADGRLAVVSRADGIARVTRMILLPGRAALPGLALTHDGRYLLAADGASGLVVVSVALATQPEAAAVLGRVSMPAPADAAAIGVLTSMDDRLAFVTLEKGDGVAVFDLAAAIARGFAGSSYLAFVPTGLAPVGMATSPDGRWLYVTSAIASASAANGTLSVIDIATVASDPSNAVVATVAAGCGPVRVAVSSDGTIVWVTARESNELIGFSSLLLSRDPDHARVAEVRVGQAPVALVPLDGGRQIAVADSNRFLVPGAKARISLIDTAAALAGRPALLGTIATGQFPRALALLPDGKTLLVADYDSSELEAIELPAR